MTITHKIKKRKDLLVSEINQMFNLMDYHYENSRRITFEKDLSEKTHIIILENSEENKIIGFSTLEIFDYIFYNQKITVMYSGDTIIEKKFWGTLELPIAFGKIMFHLFEKKKENKIYWLLISKGARTYKYLPVFCEEYFPSLKKETPTYIKELMTKLGVFKFQEQFNKKTGIIEAKNNSQYLKPEYQPDKQFNSNKHVRFFIEKNPNYHKGDELLCLTELSEENINSYIKKAILKRIID